jgi:hypothetical protein
MNYTLARIFLLLLLGPLVARSQLVVVVSSPKIGGQKAIVELKMKNNLSNAVASARAACCLIDDQEKLVGHSTKWVIGQDKHSLEPKGERTFDFVVTSQQPFMMTNLVAKVSFSQVVLEDGKLTDPRQSVTVISAMK